MKKSKILGIIIALGMCVGVPTCSAAMLSPAVIDVDIQPRDIVTETLVLENTTGAKATFFGTVNDVTGGVDGGIQEFVPPSMSDRTSSLASWVEFSRSGVELMPGERREIPLTIRVTPTALPGDYHAMIAFAPGTTVDDAMRLINARSVPITFINATYLQKKEERIDLSRFFVKKFITTFRDGDAQYRVENKGDTELVPSGDILIYNQRGEEVASLPVNPQRQSVKPGETKVFTTGIPIDDLLGKYKAFLTLRYGGNQAAVYDTVFFYAVPWKKILVLFGVVALVALAFSLWMHRRYRARVGEDEDDDLWYHPPSDGGAVELPLAIRGASSRAHPRDVVMKKR